MNDLIFNTVSPHIRNSLRYMIGVLVAPVVYAFLVKIGFGDFAEIITSEPAQTALVGGIMAIVTGLWYRVAKSKGGAT